MHKRRSVEEHPAFMQRHNCSVQSIKFWYQYPEAILKSYYFLNFLKNDCFILFDFFQFEYICAHCTMHEVVDHCSISCAFSRSACTRTVAQCFAIRRCQDGNCIFILNAFNYFMIVRTFHKALLCLK